MSVDRAGVALVLEQIASCLELQGGNAFRIRAFRTAAKAVLGLSEEAPLALANGSLAATKGVGPATVSIVKELVETGRCALLDRLREEIPPGMVEMLRISGLGVSRIRTIHERLKIETLTELEDAARDGRLASLPGFGVKTADTVLRGIAYLRRVQAFRLFPEASQEAELLGALLARLPGVSGALVAGAVRRRSEVIKDLDLVLVAEGPGGEVVRSLRQVPGLEEIVAENPQRVTGRTHGGMPARIAITPPVHLGAALVQATGTETHLERLAGHAASLGFGLADGALSKGGDVVPTPDEATLYRALGLPEIPPELREGGDEIDRAQAGSLPRLLEAGDLVGLLHCHTTYSDGTLSVERMAEACRTAGYGYLGVTDHSQAAAYAGGLSVESLHAQWAEIDALNARGIGIRILKGIESDILADGQLDYDAATLARFDFVIGSIHSRFAMTQAEITARVLRAMDNPHLTILGHPTGRVLLSRDPYPIDLEQVFRKAASHGIALEINADPHRLDLDWRLLRRARDLGVMITIGADAHGSSGLEYVRYGVAMARKGWLSAPDVLNTRSADDFLAFARARRP